ncbi:MAG: NUDIX domain-containing protein, partial [Candidatus Nanohaloarchaea archaeon]|nr:NUDIX domain-containing protein [Candidatus Nanohaloarchaea archaeon]
MKEEERVCVVLYKLMGDSPRYAVLKRVKNWEGWELVKGHLEDGLEETARQEVKEETGIEEIKSIEPLECEAGWTYEEDGEEVQTRCDCFLVQVGEDASVSVDQNPHEEHEHGYFLNHRDARDILTHDTQRRLLSLAR